MTRVVMSGGADVVLSDGAGQVEIKSTPGGRTARITDRAGKVIFDGPTTTTEQRAALPDAVKTQLGKLDQLAPRDFKNAPAEMEFDVKVVAPREEKIRFVPSALSSDRSGLL